MSEFTGKAGTIYVTESNVMNERPIEIWYEHFCILGTGNTEQEALEDASRHTVDILELILQAKGEIGYAVGVGVG